MKRIAILVLMSCFPSILSAEGEGGSYTPYPEGRYHAAAAPAGFKICYVSHYARHGSRYLLSEQEFAAVDILQQYEDALSPPGSALLSDLLLLQSVHKGMLGMLSRKGMAQHEGIGRNMARHLKDAFRSKDREIRCISSPAQRCIQSMSSCALGLRDGGAKGPIRMDAGYKYYAVISPRMDDSSWRSVAEEIRDSLLLSAVVPSLGARFFLPGRIPDPAVLTAFSVSLYWMGAAAAGLDGDVPDIFGGHIPPEILDGMRRAENAFDYCLFCETSSRGNIRMEKTAKPLLGEILDKADDALRSGTVAADLRFGHDSGLLPLMQLAGIGPFASQRVPEKAFEDGWHNDEMIPMAANLQLVFCRNARGKVLVQFLYNERETVLPALQPVTGPWYDWPEVRVYFQEKADCTARLR